MSELLFQILPSLLEIILDQLQSIRESLSYPMEEVSFEIPSPITLMQAEPIVDAIQKIANELSVPYYILLEVFKDR